MRLLCAALDVPRSVLYQLLMERVDHPGRIPRGYRYGIRISTRSAVARSSRGSARSSLPIPGGRNSPATCTTRPNAGRIAPEVAAPAK
jgi:hypothetical protein